MTIGINLTSPITSATPLALLHAGHAEFCELMVDNFLHLEPETMRQALGDVPVAFHIMNSQFLENDEASLADMAGRVRELIDALEPIYVSDHLGRFRHGGRQLPLVMELDYETELERTIEGVMSWQDRLGMRIQFETFPSIFPGGRNQVDFYRRLVERTGCGVLFDISNAIVAELNCGAPADDWLPMAASFAHFHIAGYMHEDAVPPIVVDSHDRNVSAESLAFARRVRAARPAGAPFTITIERDENHSVESWLIDLEAVRHAFA